MAFLGGSVRRARSKRGEILESAVDLEAIRNQRGELREEALKGV